MERQLVSKKKLNLACNINELKQWHLVVRRKSSFSYREPLRQNKQNWATYANYIPRKFYSLKSNTRKLDTLFALLDSSVGSWASVLNVLPFPVFKIHDQLSIFSRTCGRGSSKVVQVCADLANAFFSSTLPENKNPNSIAFKIQHPSDSETKVPICQHFPTLPTTLGFVLSPDKKRLSSLFYHHPKWLIVAPPYETNGTKNLWWISIFLMFKQADPVSSVLLSRFSGFVNNSCSIPLLVFQLMFPIMNNHPIPFSFDNPVLSPDVTWGPFSYNLHWIMSFF